MIDTVKIGSVVNNNCYNLILSKMTCKTSFDFIDNKVHYIITSTSLKGSFDSSLSVRCQIYKNKPYVFIERIYT